MAKTAPVAKMVEAGLMSKTMPKEVEKAKAKIEKELEKKVHDVAEAAIQQKIKEDVAKVEATAVVRKVPDIDTALRTQQEKQMVDAAGAAQDPGRSEINPMGDIPLNHDNEYDAEDQYFSVVVPALGRQGDFHFEADSPEQAQEWMQVLSQTASKKKLIQQQWETAERAQAAAESEKLQLLKQRELIGEQKQKRRAIKMEAERLKEEESRADGQ